MSHFIVIIKIPVLILVCITPIENVMVIAELKNDSRLSKHVFETYYYRDFS